PSFEQAPGVVEHQKGDEERPEYEHEAGDDPYDAKTCKSGELEHNPRSAQRERIETAERRRRDLCVRARWRIAGPEDRELRECLIGKVEPLGERAVRSDHASLRTDFAD